MRLRPALRALSARWRHPALWLGAVVLPLVQAVPVAYVPLSEPWTHLPVRQMLTAASLIWCLSVLLAGLPFQWTGDDRPQSKFLRGFFQWLALEVLLIALGLACLPWNLAPRDAGMTFGIVVAGMSANLFLILLLNWLLVRAETEDAEVTEAEQRARAAERLVARQTLSPRTIHATLSNLLEEAHPHHLERGLVDLAVLFRTRLMLQSLPMVPFAQERGLVEQLLQVLQRTGRLPKQLHQSWGPDTDGLSIPSLAVVQVVEILADLLETCPLESLILTGHRMDALFEICLQWRGEHSGALLNRLEAHPDFQALERRLAGAAFLREPLSLERSEGGGCLRLCLPVVRP